ncbi:hypothetical protein P280DRAFT_551593 [Massarina eburnea CBS 473.64]|uniref:Uncharacterized protein n=1 Tax=Massarina eburnea CBS 473.64 TaxID=1395130 RepID=A0A6A6RS13_9PLEO|nr:hypothetical protein P280DRAFT_551593 [Massarina eburnea CBS 473.64]
MRLFILPILITIATTTAALPETSAWLPPKIGTFRMQANHAPGPYDEIRPYPYCMSTTPWTKVMNLDLDWYCTFWTTKDCSGPVLKNVFGGPNCKNYPITQKQAPFYKCYWSGHKRDIAIATAPDEMTREPSSLQPLGHFDPREGGPDVPDNGNITVVNKCIKTPPEAGWVQLQYDLESNGHACFFFGQRGCMGYPSQIILGPNQRHQLHHEDFDGWYKCFLVNGPGDLIQVLAQNSRPTLGTEPEPDPESPPPGYFSTGDHVRLAPYCNDTPRNATTLQLFDGWACDFFGDDCVGRVVLHVGGPVAKEPVTREARFYHCDGKAVTPPG